MSILFQVEMNLYCCAGAQGQELRGGHGPGRGRALRPDLRAAGSRLPGSCAPGEGKAFNVSNTFRRFGGSAGRLLREFLDEMNFVDKT